MPYWHCQSVEWPQEERCSDWRDGEFVGNADTEAERCRESSAVDETEFREVAFTVNVNLIILIFYRNIT